MINPTRIIELIRAPETATTQEVQALAAMLAQEMRLELHSDGSVQLASGPDLSCLEDDRREDVLNLRAQEAERYLQAHGIRRVIHMTSGVDIGEPD